MVYRIGELAKNRYEQAYPPVLRKRRTGCTERDTNNIKVRFFNK